MFGIMEATRLESLHVTQDPATGLQAIERAQIAWPGMRAIIITGDTSAHQLQSLANCGAPVLHKPFNTEARLQAGFDLEELESLLAAAD